MSDLYLDREWFSELVTYWHSWLLLTNCETGIMTLGVIDSDSDLDSIRNSCDVFHRGHLIGASSPLSLWSISNWQDRGAWDANCPGQIFYFEKKSPSRFPPEKSSRMSRLQEVVVTEWRVLMWLINWLFSHQPWSIGLFGTPLHISSLMLPVSNVCISSAGWFHIWIFLSRALKKWTHLSCFASNWS